MKRITVFCGSGSGTDAFFYDEAFRLGQALANRNIGLVYGGARVGLMGAVADGALANGGEAIGVLPHFLQQKELAHETLSELVLVESMHERKTKMNELCDGVIALPGGFGTLEELFEMLTWAQLGLHKKPIGLLNARNYFNGLLTFIDTMAEQGFLKSADRQLLTVDTTIDGLLAGMEAYEAPVLAKWIQKDEV